MTNSNSLRNSTARARLGCLLVALLTAGTSLLPALSPPELLEKGIYTEETKGELESAAQIYQQIIDDPGTDHALAAQARLRLGLCQLKQGNKPRATATLERLTAEFPDSAKLASLAGQPMPQLLDDMVRQIQQNYIQEVDRDALVATALRAILGKLGSEGGLLRTNDIGLLGTNEMAELNVSLEQKMVGIGAMLRLDESNHEIVVESPLPNSPAFNAGLLAGDRIILVNGESLPETNRLHEAVKLLRGPAGTRVNASVKRAGVDQLLPLEFTRDTVKLASVIGDHRRPDLTWDYQLDPQNGVGYVRITQIGQQTASELEQALKELKAGGQKSLVLDLRSNPGGELAGAVSVAALFLEKGRIVTVKSRNGEQIYDAQTPGPFANFNLAVLVNRETASAAEIVAASLQDNQRAVVVGERTFGQGLIKSLIPLNGDAGVLKLPVAAYYRPNGKAMNRFPDSKETDDWGVSPDNGLEVKLADPEFKAYEKYRDEQEKLSSAGSTKAAFQDRQLQFAVTFLLNSR